MIQSLPTRRSEWLLLWVELDEPIRAPGDFVILPTFLIVTDSRGVPLAPPQLLAEIDQSRAEAMLARLFEQEGRPQRLTISHSEDWEDEVWQDFGLQYEIEVRFQELPGNGEFRILEAAQLPTGRVETGENLAENLLESALRVRSPRRREAYLRKCLELSPGLSAARVELGDIEFSRGEWKKCLQNYRSAAEAEKARWREKSPQWWEDPATRPYLRSLYGQGMTLWHQGKYLETADFFAAILQLNARDHQGVRFYIPMLQLLGEQYEEAAAFFRMYEEKYRGDFPDPAFHFGWGLSLSIEGEELRAKEKYRLGILRNNYLAPELLEEPEPPPHLWFPNDRCEPGYAAEFVSSYSILWERESGAMRLVRETWEECQSEVEAIVACRRRLLDFQDQRFDPEYKKHWEELVEEEARLSGGLLKV